MARTRLFGSRSFEKLVLQDERQLWVVEFYADWCGHCKQFAKGYEKAATNLKGVVRFGAVNADSSSARKTSQSQGVQGFPSVKVYVPGTGQRNPYTGKLFKPPIEYNGPRSARGVVDFATKSLPSQVLAVTDASLSAFKSNGTLPKALLFTAKTETTALFKSLSLSFGGRMLVGEARETATKVSVPNVSPCHARTAAATCRASGSTCHDATCRSQCHVSRCAAHRRHRSSA